MSVPVCICTCIYVYLCMYSHVYTYMSVPVCICTCIYVYLCMYSHVYTYMFIPICICTCIYVYLCMGWLQLVGSIKFWVSFAEYSLFNRDLLQKRPLILSILLTEATPYLCISCVHTYVHIYVFIFVLNSSLPHISNLMTLCRL